MSGTGGGAGHEFGNRVREIVQQLAVLLRNMALHDPGNEVFREPMARVRELVAPLVAAEGALDIEFVGSELFANQTRVRVHMRNMVTVAAVAGELRRRGLGGLHLGAAPSDPDLQRLLGVLRSRRSASLEEIEAALAAAGVVSLQVLPPREDVVEPDADRRQRAIQVYQQALDFIRDCVIGLDSPAKVNLRRAKRLVHKLVDLSYEQGEGFSLAGLTAIKSYDEYTFHHMVNVCVLSIAFGHRLGLERAQMAQLGLSALYHDLGKLHVPLELLTRHGPLTEQEWAVMGNHTTFGARELYPMVEADPDTLRRILTALQHHLGWDRSGYPDLRVVDRLTLFSRIVAIVDAFDAMTSKRVYQRRFLPDEALAIILKASGGRYDPVLVKAFINAMGIFPVGSTVVLTSGELAVVRESKADPEQAHRPVVRLVAVEGSPDDGLVDLALPEHAARQIVRCVDPDEHGVNAAHFAF